MKTLGFMTIRFWNWFRDLSKMDDNNSKKWFEMKEQAAGKKRLMLLWFIYRLLGKKSVIFKDCNPKRLVNSSFQAFFELFIQSC